MDLVFQDQDEEVSINYAWMITAKRFAFKPTMYLIYAINGIALSYIVKHAIERLRFKPLSAIV